MNKTLTFAAIAALFAVPAALAGEKMSFTDIDTNSDAMLSLEEIQVVAPDVTAADVATYDTDADGVLSEAEYDVWKDAKKMDGDKSEMKDESESY